MNLIIPIAYAQEAAPQGPSLTYNLFLIGGMLLLLYLLLIRPQSKRAKEHRQLVAGIAEGDEVLTSGGLVGKVAKVGDDYLTVEVASGVKMKLLKSAVTAALPKGTIKEI